MHPLFRRGRSFGLLLALLAPVLLTASTSRVSAQANPRFGPHLAALIDAAAKEGHLELSWSASGFGDNGKGIGEWIDAFNRFYGLHLTYTFTGAPSMSQQVTGLIQQAQSGAPASTDVMILGSDYMLPAMNAHATIPNDWSTLAKEAGVALPAAAVAPGNAGVAFSTAVFGIAYNSKAVPADQAPQTLADVLKPQWKGRVGSTLDAAGFNFLAAFDPKWGPAKTEAYIRAFSQQIGGLTRCNQTEPLLDGQFDLNVMWCDVATVILERDRGVPLGYTVPRDGPVINFWYMAVPKGSPDPAAAALLAVFMLTKQGQDLNWKWDRHDLALLPGSRSAALLPSNPAAVAGGRGVQEFAGHPETLQYTSQYMQILRAVAPK